MARKQLRKRITKRPDETNSTPTISQVLAIPPTDFTASTPSHCSSVDQLLSELNTHGLRVVLRQIRGLTSGGTVDGNAVDTGGIYRKEETGPGHASE